jgi:hypothetical protein
MKFFTITLMILSLLAIVDCATIEKGNLDPISFTSDIQSAEVWVDGQLLGNTPVTLRLLCGIPHKVEFRAPGYESKTYTIQSYWDVKYLVIDIILGVVPVVVDAITGSWFVLEPNQVNAYFKGASDPALIGISVEEPKTEE